MSEQNFLALILEREEQTGALIAEAQERARRQIEEAQAEAERRTIAARAAAERQYRRILDDARIQAGNLEREVLTATGEQTRLIREAAAPVMEKAVRIIAERIIK
jgi:vacuolar-type H+-ATPase subunit H